MKNKYKQIEDYSGYFEKLLSFPKLIFHDRLDFDGKWVKEPKPWVFNLSVDDILYSYFISYNLIGEMDETIQYLPIPEEEVLEAAEIGYYGSFTGGFRGDNLQELIDKMNDWLKKECII